MKRIHMWAAGVGAGAIAVTAAISPVAFAGGPQKGTSHDKKEVKSWSAPPAKAPSKAPVKAGEAWKLGNSRAKPKTDCTDYPWESQPKLTGVVQGTTVTGNYSVHGCAYQGVTVSVIVKGGKGGKGKVTTAVTDAKGNFTATIEADSKKVVVYLSANSNQYTGAVAFTRLEIGNSGNFHKPKPHEDNSHGDKGYDHR